MIQRYVDNLISGSSAFSKSSFYIWKFSVHILLKPVLKDFEHNLAGMWNESSLNIFKPSPWGNKFCIDGERLETFKAICQ